MLCATVYACVASAGVICPVHRLLSSSDATASQRATIGAKSLPSTSDEVKSRESSVMADESPSLDPNGMAETDKLCADGVNGKEMSGMLRKGIVILEQKDAS